MSAMTFTACGWTPKREQPVAIVGEATYRVWRLYMTGSAYYFDEGSLNVYQILASSAHQPLAIPLRRDDLDQ
jgi:cyclopropane-fatty-acyl-phospholipid synthase